MKIIMLILVLGSQPGTIIDYHTVPMDSMQQCQELREVIEFFTTLNGEPRHIYCLEK